MKKRSRLLMGAGLAASVLVFTGCSSSSSGIGDNDPDTNAAGADADNSGRALIKTAIDSLANLQTNLESLQGGVSDLTDDAANEASVDAIIDNVIVAGYTDLNNKVLDLVTALTTLKDTPTQLNLDAAQDAWKAAREPWESGEGHIFGPIDTMGVDPASDSWPVIKSDLDGSLGGWEIGNSVEGFADEVKGFHAIEYILFGDGELTNTREIDSLTATQSEYALALAISMQGQTQALNDEWTNNYTETFKGFTPAEAAEELLGGLIGIADEVGNGKMGDPYNEKNTTLVESQFSWNSTTDFSNNIVSVKNVWEAGMNVLMTQVDATASAEITTLIDESITNIKAISDADGDGEIDADIKSKAFRNQILDTGSEGEGRILIKSAIDSLATLQTSLESLQNGVSDLEDDATNEAYVDAITDNVIVTGYTTLNNQVLDLITGLTTLRDTPTQENLEAAQDAWKAARVPWESGEGHIFGPIDTMGVDPASDSWPVIKSDLNGSLGGWTTGDSVEGFADEVKGFHAIEYILFGDGELTNTHEIDTLTPTQLEYVLALAISMQGQTQALIDEWNNNYTGTFKGFTPAEAAEELLGGLIGIADEVGNGKMGDPYNEKNTTLVESQFSWNSTTDFANNIVSVKNVWDAGMDALMAQIDADTAADIATQIDASIANIKAISDNDGDGEIDADVRAKAFRNQILN